MASEGLRREYVATRGSRWQSTEVSRNYDPATHHFEAPRDRSRPTNAERAIATYSREELAVYDLADAPSLFDITD